MSFYFPPSPAGTGKSIIIAEEVSNTGPEYAAMQLAVNKIILGATPLVNTAPVAAPKPKALAQKVMTVQLKSSKPTTRFNDEQAAKVARASLGDEGVGAYVKLFSDPMNPARQLLAKSGAPYQYHKKHTMPYIDRGPRFLPVGLYEEYRDEMRALRSELAADKAAVIPKYDTYVALDVAYRNAKAAALGNVGRATAADYPTAEQFEKAIDFQVTFMPLPDRTHAVFDVDEEDQKALDTFMEDALKRAVDDLRERITTPLHDLIDKLNETPKKKGSGDEDGKGTGIFRDTKITNVTDAVAIVRKLAMEDSEVLAACDMVESAMKPVVDYPEAVRQSPVVREAAAKRLADVASKMGAFFGG
ncbi:MAG: hypothetical protein HXX17_07985 [Geobacteraceae bacterium]|nr:hypothetical protein [Geobacteraceae bacterium]